MYNTKLLGMLLACMFSLCAYSSLSGQNSVPKREVGLGFSGLNFNNSSFSVFYKKQRKENVYRRISFVGGNVAGSFARRTQQYSFRVGLGIGREKRIKLDDKLTFYHGPEISGGVESQLIAGESINAFGINASFGWVIGLMHKFNERWGVNLEAIPRFSAIYSYRQSPNGSTENIAFNLSGSNQVSLGLFRMF